MSVKYLVIDIGTHKINDIFGNTRRMTPEELKDAKDKASNSFNDIQGIDKIFVEQEGQMGVQYDILEID